MMNCGRDTVAAVASLRASSWALVVTKVVATASSGAVITHGHGTKGGPGGAGPPIELRL